MPYNPTNVKAAAGTLYAAPLGTTEPTTITGAWPAGWVTIGFTDIGSEFTFGPQTADLLVEEEYFPIRTVITSYAGQIVFAMAETTQRNLAFALNAGIGAGVVANTQGVNGDGSVWQENPDPGSEVHVMLGWDSQFEGAPSGSDPFQRLIIRQAFQDSPIKRMNRKGANKALWAASFKIERPVGSSRPFRYIFNSAMTS